MERIQLLNELQYAISRGAVKASLWACLQVCDLLKLCQLVEMAIDTTNWAFFKLFEDIVFINPPEMNATAAVRALLELSIIF